MLHAYYADLDATICLPSGVRNVYKLHYHINQIVFVLSLSLFLSILTLTMNNNMRTSFLNSHPLLPNSPTNHCMKLTCGSLIRYLPNISVISYSS